MIKIQIIIQNDLRTVVGSFEGVMCVCLDYGLDEAATSVKRLLNNLRTHDAQLAIYTPNDSIDILKDRPQEQRLFVNAVVAMLDYLDEKESRIYVSDVPHV